MITNIAINILSLQTLNHQINKYDNKKTESIIGSI